MSATQSVELHQISSCNAHLAGGWGGSGADWKWAQEVGGAGGYFKKKLIKVLGVLKFDCSAINPSVR